MPTKSRFRFRCRDKIEPNLQSQNVRRTHSQLQESRFQRITNITLDRRRSTVFRQISVKFYASHPIEAKALRWTFILWGFWERMWQAKLFQSHDHHWRDSRVAACFERFVADGVYRQKNRDSGRCPNCQSIQPTWFQMMIEIGAKTLFQRARPPAFITGDTEATAFPESVLPLNVRCDGSVN